MGALADLGKKKLDIIDDGAGVGKFLAELKEEPLKRKITSRTIALTLESNRQLERRKKTGQIDEVVVGPLNKLYNAGSKKRPFAEVCPLPEKRGLDGSKSCSCQRL